MRKLLFKSDAFVDLLLLPLSSILVFHRLRGTLNLHDIDVFFGYFYRFFGLALVYYVLISPLANRDKLPECRFPSFSFFIAQFKPHVIKTLILLLSDYFNCCIDDILSILFVVFLFFTL